MTAAAAAILVAAAGLAAVSVVQAGANRRLRESRDLLVVAVDDATRANLELREANARERQARAERNAASPWPAKRSSRITPAPARTSS